jgi:hypothetical protein
MPFIVYIPGKWALLFNQADPVGRFGAPPPEWPELGTPVLFCEGQYRDFVGQLLFDVEIDDIVTAAVGFPDSFPASIDQPDVKAFAYMVHENFHQYQRAAFGEIPWEREEKYPIEDVDNSTLAYLEMKLLSRAVESMARDDRESCRRFTEQFVAVRQARWSAGDPFIATYEQGKELLEGTANYVELKSIGLAAGLEYESRIDGIANPVEGHFSGLSADGLLLDEFRERMGDGFIPVEDIARNRIYAVAGAQGFLLDYFNIPWKASAEIAGPGFTFVGLLRDGLEIDDGRLEALAEGAKASVDFEAIRSATARAVEEYLKGYAEQLAAFESQPGFRIEFEASANGVFRSRTSRAKKWIVQNGTRCLRSHYEVYTLRGAKWSLDVHDTGLLEMDDWDTKWRKVVFYVQDLPKVVIDDESFSPSDDATLPFKTIEMEGKDFSLECSRAGSVTLAGKTLTISLAQDPANR